MYSINNGLKIVLYKFLLYGIIKVQKKIPVSESSYRIKNPQKASSEGFAIIVS